MAIKETLSMDILKEQSRGIDALYNSISQTKTEHELAKKTVTTPVMPGNIVVRNNRPKQNVTKTTVSSVKQNRRRRSVCFVNSNTVFYQDEKRVLILNGNQTICITR